MNRIPRGLRLSVLCVVCVVALVATADNGANLRQRTTALLAAIDFQGLSNSIGVALLQDPFPESRRLAARALASDADADRLRLLSEYAGDSDAWTRYYAMVAAGRIGPPAIKIAQRGLKDAAPVVRQAAVWAACHGGDEGFAAVTQLLEREYDASVLETAVANLWRFGELDWEPHAAGFAGRDKPGFRRAAASALARSDRSSRADALRRLVADPEPVIRATALGGYRKGPLTAADQRVILGAVWDGDWRVQAEACAVLAAREEIQVSDDAANAVEALWSDSRAQLAVPALRAAARHRTIGSDETLQHMVEAAEPWPAAEALQALARRGAKAWKESATAWFDSDERWRRRAAARAAAIGVGQEPTPLERRAQNDPDPAVRLAYLERLDADAVQRRREFLWTLATSDPDPMVRSQCVDHLAAAGELSSVEKALELYRKWAADDAGDARAAALLAALNLSDEAGQPVIVELAAADSNRAVTAMVVNRARELGVAGTVMSGDPRHGQKWYRDLVAWVDEPRWLDVETTRGTFRIKLETADAPITSREIWDLADRGFYDGLTFHRVVPNFVVQGGDPRGDGWGGPGFVLPDEPSLRPFDSWRVGIATSGPQTGGSQFFFMLLPSDRLTGHYTNFGEVVAGRDVLTRLQVGDEIRSVDTQAGTEPPPPVAVKLGHLEWNDVAELDGWEDERTAYQPNAESVELLRSVVGRYRIMTVLGTWCSDSEREVPRLQRVLDEVGPGGFEHVMVGVDRSKRIADPEVAMVVTGGDPVELVPTIVVIDELGMEVGRIVETAEQPIEELLAFFLAPLEGWQ